MLNVKIKLMDNGKLPQYQRTGDACLDCYSAEMVTIRNGDRQLVKLGFALQLPMGYEAIIRPRSGFSKRGIDVAIGTVDENYRGEVMANVINNSGETFLIEYGTRICQMAIRPIEYINFETVEKLDETDRGADGFGSSGNK